MEISQDLDHVPIVFIRFNPDSYVEYGKRVLSCWGINGYGICAVKKSKAREWSDRLSKLADRIRYWIATDVERTITVENIFFDTTQDDVEEAES